MVDPLSWEITVGSLCCENAITYWYPLHETLNSILTGKITYCRIPSGKIWKNPFATNVQACPITESKSKFLHFLNTDAHDMTLGVKDKRGNRSTYPSILRQTLPFLYRLGLNLTVSPPVVSNRTLGGWSGYWGPNLTRKWKNPPSYGVSNGPIMRQWTLNRLSSSGAANIPGSGSVKIVLRSLKSTFSIYS